ncbi:MAG: MerR family transcriptional regulator [Pseudolabrys sp.]|nr:MerR family transcriptional regulator [Pseudolabrys sp.]
MDSKAPDAFRTISEVADELDLPQHVLRFWESRFREIKPMKRGGGRRYYRPGDVDLLRGIRHLLYGEGYTIRGVQRILREQGSNFVEAVWREGAPQPPHGARDDDDGDVTSAEGATPERPGLLGRLLGRDTGGREEEVAERSEPPMHAAPIVSPSRVSETETPVIQEDPTPMQAIPTISAVARRDDVGRLHAALHELAECRRLIDAVLTRT